MGFFRSWNKGDINLPKSTSQQAAYNQLVAQANSAVGSYLTTSGTGGGTYTVTTTGNGIFNGGGVYAGIGVPIGGGIGGAMGTINTVYTNQAQPFVPSPNGYQVHMLFVDANGISHTITVDQAYMSLLQQISYRHQCGTGYNVPTAAPPKPVMVEGEFSYDEMEKAELLIEELNAHQESA